MELWHELLSDIGSPTLLWLLSSINHI